MSAGDGKNGDLYIVIPGYDLYEKIAGTWTLIGNILGATGPTGPTGPTGATAPPGRV